MIVLPLLKVQVAAAMIASIVSGGLISLFVQHMEVAELLKALIFGYAAEGSLGTVMNGGFP